MGIRNRGIAFAKIALPVEETAMAGGCLCSLRKTLVPIYNDSAVLYRLFEHS